MARATYERDGAVCVSKSNTVGLLGSQVPQGECRPGAVGGLDRFGRPGRWHCVCRGKRWSSWTTEPP